MKTIKFGIIGAGLMGREFASAAARWSHLPDMQVRPELVAVCDKNPVVLDWYRQNFPYIQSFTTDYRELLASAHVEAVYCAVPHNLHAELYTAIIKAGKHLMGEKPFGIDLSANRAILACLQAHPKVFVRCSSEFPFYPAVQRIGNMIETRAFGRIIEVNNYFLHSSDLDPAKPMNWKRMIEFNGEYGCLGDLGLHVCHVPFRAGWIPKNVRAILSDIVKERPDGKGGHAPCRTWDNATLLCEASDPVSNALFPLTLKTLRIAPGEKDTWSIEILGTKASARFSTKNPKLLQIMEYRGGEQVWQHIDMGHETAFKSITGGIFEFGFSDSILQMWAAFLYELTEAKPMKQFAACVTPDETALSHRLFTAALESQAKQSVVAIK
ncbi:MAG: Gfo/Idh/MocA family oxidoreductase [Kiritimatiellae bacterium]|nr:Gfo/Idh/MocA family oxidoreductase [Kiritimatiellia bacterium]